MQLGVSEKNAAPFTAAIKRESGVDVRYVRLYKQGQPWPWDDVEAADKLGLHVVVSQKSDDWPGDAQGKYDAKWTAIARGLAQLKPGVFVYHHEPENDGKPAADYVKGYNHVVGLMKPMMPGWRFGPCYIDWNFHPRGPKTGMAFYPGDALVDVFITDPYNWRGAKTVQNGGDGYAEPGAKDRDPAEFFVGVAAFAASHNKRTIFGEFGTSILKTDQGGAQRSDYLNRFSDWVEANPNNAGVRSIEAICYFEQGLPAFIEWAIREEPRSLKAFARLASGEVIPEPEPEPEPDPCADVQAKLDNMTKERNELSADLSKITDSLTAANNKLAQIKTIANAVAKPSKSMTQIKNILAS